MAKPENTNYLQPTKFMLSFPSVTDTTFFCQKANIPGPSVTEVPRSVPNLELYMPGTKISYNTFDIEFSVNEDLSAWRVVYDWLRDNTIDNKFRYTNVDAILTVLSNQNNPKLRVKYSNVFPISLGDIEFDTRLSANEHISALASFRFDYYNIEML